MKNQKSNMIETGAVMIDVGSYTTKIGNCGDISPKFIIPSCSGIKGKREIDASKENTTETAKSITSQRDRLQDFVFCHENLTYPHQQMDIIWAMENGSIKNWDVYESLLRYGIYHSHALNFEDLERHPVIISETPWNKGQSRMKQMEILFESLGTKMGFIARASSLAAFSAGRPTGMVLDIGHHSTSISPVVDGFTLTRNVERSAIGGEMLSKALTKWLEANDIEIDPFYDRKGGDNTKGKTGTMHSSSSATPSSSSASASSNQPLNQLHDLSQFTKSYLTYQTSSTIEAIKESTISLKPLPIDPTTLADCEIPYELPDGQVIDINKGAYLVSETLWNPSCWVSFAEYTMKSGISGTPDTFGSGAASATPQTSLSFSPTKLLSSIEEIGLSKSKSVTSTLISCFENVDPTIRRELWGNLLVVGGGSCVKGFSERFVQEVDTHAPASVRVKVIASTILEERKVATWIGGSLLGSLESFTQKWVSKAEYDEVGPSIVEKKCLC
ncbi:actin-related protein 4 [Monocercomonoides exilis]|uniref:actin-related protein 4 n=1 Tax=Monocercomonoides exilis TaxID=2049356 RepID=UPI00355A1FD4|nr:actin-related protein 4 [Monocercomonoides exilis]|eukprot:MONOS_5672.1-p1 / transcript=MONOS_5672.1 / gene=MONOS_5672 / organism=Monocercomonoides_exilis_PA203 / gene_product=actin-related protein 4 / transcript_product=actin-related protein 4 / location=Mono_scaffold00168:22447-24147(+) / protein_length=500 / sequence_SO=supercontig / SO=protein_coding / is_pseudo=false